MCNLNSGNSDDAKRKGSEFGGGSIRGRPVGYKRSENVQNGSGVRLQERCLVASAGEPIFECTVYPVRRGKCLRRGSIQGPSESESNVITTKLLEGLPAKGFTSLPHGLSE